MENSDEVGQCHERERLKMRVAVLEESVRSWEVECRTSRETVQRLLEELERERRKASSSAAALDSLKVELDGLSVGRRSVELDKETLTERLEASKRVTEAAERESRCLQTQVEELEAKLQSTEVKQQTLLRRVAGLLQQGRSHNTGLTTEKEVLQRVEEMMSETEVRLSRSSVELQEQTQLRHSALQRAQLAEQQVQDLRDRLQAAETKLLTADMHHDRLQLCKQHHEEFLQQLSEALMVDGMDLDLDLDLGLGMRLKLLLSRAEQLAKKEEGALAESKSLASALQRKLKTQREQLESKGLHVQLLRKKVSELEEDRSRSRSALAGERDGVHLENRRLQKKLERLQGELRALRQSNGHLKGQASHNNELKLKVTEQGEALQEQRRRLERLQEVKVKVEKKLSSANSDLQSREQRSREDEEQLRSLRQSLTQLTHRERELSDFRMVVSQMLSLDAMAPPLPNQEIIKLLEAVLHAHHHHHHLHHHVAMPQLHCPTHHRPHVCHSQDLPLGSSPFDVSTSRFSAQPEDAVSP